MSVLTPELLGLIYKNRNVNLRETLCDNATNKKIKLLATFIPDQLIFLIEQRAKLAVYDFVILLYTEFPSLSFSYEQFCNIDNNESCEFTKICNSLIGKIVKQICASGGDVIKITDNGVLSLWVLDNDHLIQELMCTVISCCFAIKRKLQISKDDFHHLFPTPLKFAISCGSVTISVIGDTDALHYVIIGEPLTALRRASGIYKPQDIILTASAWEHCNLSDYNYVILDKSHIKIIEQLRTCANEEDHASRISMKGSLKTTAEASEFSRPSTQASEVSSMISVFKYNRYIVDPTANIDHGKDLESNRPALAGPYVKNVGSLLRSFVVDSIVKQIEKDMSFEYVTEFRNITVVLVEVASMKTTTTELITLTDECHKIILAACENVGCIVDVSLRDSIVVFRIVFGIGGHSKDLNHCRFGVACAWKLLHALESVTHVSRVSVGVSSGISCVTVIGYMTRQEYKVIGAPILKTENMMPVTQRKVTCDLDTVIHSEISKSHFVPQGLANLRGHKQDYIFHYTHRNELEERASTELKDAYPILDRFEILELFSEILDDVGIPNRQHAGILIEGKNRIGKSRVLDGFVLLAKARRMALVKIVLHPTFVHKPYAVLYKILEQILEAEWCKTVSELERNIVRKLGHALLPEELCYLNRILRVRFELSKQYLTDSDWDRHKKTLSIFDKILEINDEKRCIILDNVEHMDYMSWQFLSQAISHANVVLAMTMLEAKTWDELSRVETDMCRDKRLLRHILFELKEQWLSALACQFLNVQAVAAELHKFLLYVHTNHPGWVELFLSLMTECCAFDIVKLTPDEAVARELIFPDVSYTTKISSDLLPEETAPPQPWNKKERVAVCLVNDNFDIAKTFVSYNIRELSLEIYSRLSTYEQSVVRCASLIGKLFLRDTLELILPDHEPLKTAEAIEKLMRIRIVECVSLQRQTSKVADLVVCSFKPRSTFSDMHHLLRCRCHLQPTPPSEQHLARYSQCRHMEFKSSTFLRLVREQFSDQEKRDGHSLIAEIYRKEAKKCVACGGGSFLRLPGREQPRKPMKRPTPIVDAYAAEPAIDDQSIIEFLVRDKKQSTLQENYDESRPSESRRISIMPSSIETDSHTGKSPEPVKNGSRRRSSNRVHPLWHEDGDAELPLDNFGHVDFRYCRCLAIINCVFQKLQQHIKHTDNNPKLINFLLEYAAALIDFGQPGFALRFLALADERNDYVSTYESWKNPATYSKMLKRSTILRLRGNAYKLLGNYPQAKTSYAEALSLFKRNYSTTGKFACQRATYERIRQNVRWHNPPTRIITVVKRERAAVVRQNTATCLSLVASTLMIKKHHKAAKLASLQSVLLGFAEHEAGNFYDQCQLYLSVVDVYGELGDFAFANGVEKLVLHAVDRKQRWNGSDEIALLAHVYAAIFRVSLLQGKLERAALFGDKALRIAKYFHMIGLEFEVLPLLIQNSMRLKRICETVDMLLRMRDIAHEDIDKSALTWYYALCMDLLLDAGIVVESYEVCADYAMEILVKRSSGVSCGILRDPNSCKRLITGLWSYQLRKSDLTTTTFVLGLDFYTADIDVVNYSQVMTLCKILECHLLLLTRCVNLKKGKQLDLLLADIQTLMRILDDLAKKVECVKPDYYLLKAYYNFVRGRTLTWNAYWRKAKNCAEMQKNLMTSARIERNRNTWKAINSFNNMAHFWEENIGYRNTIIWQDVDVFDLTDWSNLMYSLPVPDSYI